MTNLLQKYLQQFSRSWNSKQRKLVSHWVVKKKSCSITLCEDSCLLDAMMWPAGSLPDCWVLTAGRGANVKEEDFCLEMSFSPIYCMKTLARPYFFYALTQPASISAGWECGISLTDTQNPDIETSAPLRCWVGVFCGTQLCFCSFFAAYTVDRVNKCCKT